VFPATPGAKALVHRYASSERSRSQAYHLAGDLRLRLSYSKSGRQRLASGLIWAAALAPPMRRLVRRTGCRQDDSQDQLGAGRSVLSAVKACSHGPPRLSQRVRQGGYPSVAAHLATLGNSRLPGCRRRNPPINHEGPRMRGHAGVFTGTGEGTAARDHQKLQGALR
jgi:hypothetical protein